MDDWFAAANLNSALARPGHKPSDEPLLVTGHCSCSPDPFLTVHFNEPRELWQRDNCTHQQPLEGLAMDDLVDVINELAKELLENAQELDGEIGLPSPNTTKVADCLTKLCDGLAKVTDQLEDKASPLQRFVRMFRDTTVGAASKNRNDLEAMVRKYLAEHRSVLVKLQVPDRIIDRVLDQLKAEAETSGDNALVNPQSLERDNVIEPLKNLRDIVCQIARAAQTIDILANKGLITQVVKGTIGAATIVIDVTGGITAIHVDPTGWVLLKAAKSVLAGGSAVYGAVEELTVMWQRLQGQAQHNVAEENQRRLRRRGPRQRPL